MLQPNALWTLKQKIVGFKSKLFRDHVLVDLVKECLVELKSQALREKSLYQAHLRRLADPSELPIDEVEVAYALERGARIINPTFVLEGDRAKPVLCMLSIGRDFAKSVEIGTQSKVEYCKRHGYGLVILEAAPLHADRPLPWLRIPLIFRLLKMGYQSVLYLDADTLITNPAIQPEIFFERMETAGRHLMLTEDALGLNTGVMFFRRTWQSLLLLDLIYETDINVDHLYWEQYALAELVRRYPLVLSLLYIETRPRQFNSVLLDFLNPPPPDAEREIYGWKPGDFLCHFAGVRSGSRTAARMRKVRDLVDHQRNEA
jgi:hypothetical protein